MAGLRWMGAPLVAGFAKWRWAGVNVLGTGLNAGHLAPLGVYWNLYGDVSK